MTNNFGNETKRETLKKKLQLFLYIITNKIKQNFLLTIERKKKKAANNSLQLTLDINFINT